MYVFVEVTKQQKKTTTQKRTLKTSQVTSMPNMNLKKLWRKKSVTITEYDPTYKVVYLGNVLTGWAKGECSQVTGSQLRVVVVEGGGVAESCSDEGDGD